VKPGISPQIIASKTARTYNGTRSCKIAPLAENSSTVLLEDKTNRETDRQTDSHNNDNQVFSQ